MTPIAWWQSFKASFSTGDSLGLKGRQCWIEETHVTVKRRPRYRN